jgi:hypothetical protein
MQCGEGCTGGTGLRVRRPVAPNAIREHVGPRRLSRRASRARRGVGFSHCIDHGADAGLVLVGDVFVEGGAVGVGLLEVAEGGPVVVVGGEELGDFFLVAGGLEGGEVEGVAVDLVEIEAVLAGGDDVAGGGGVREVYGVGEGDDFLPVGDGFVFLGEEVGEGGGVLGERGFADLVVAGPEGGDGVGLGGGGGAFSADDGVGGEEAELAEFFGVGCIEMKLAGAVFIEELRLGNVGMQRAVHDDGGVEVAPEFVGNVGAFPAAAAGPGPEAGEEGAFLDVSEGVEAGGVLVFFEAVDEAVVDVVGVGAFAFVFTGAFDFDDEAVAAEAEDFAEGVAAVEVAFDMLDGEEEIGVGFDGVVDGQVFVDAGVEAEPGAEDDFFVVLDADVFAEELDEGDDGFVDVGLVVFGDADAAFVEGGILEVGFADADDDAVELGEAVEHLVEEEAEVFLGFGVSGVAEGVLHVLFFDQFFGEDDEVAFAVDIQAGGFGGGIFLVELAGFGVDPLPVGGVFGEDRGIDGVPVDGELSGFEEEEDFPGVAHLLEELGVVVFCDVGGFAGVVVDHVEDDGGGWGGGRGGGAGEGGEAEEGEEGEEEQGAERMGGHAGTPGEECGGCMVADAGEGCCGRRSIWERGGGGLSRSGKENGGVGGKMRDCVEEERGLLSEEMERATLACVDWRIVMKTWLLRSVILAGLTVLPLAGCVVHDHDDHRDGYYHHDEVRHDAPPVVEHHDDDIHVDVHP